MEMIDPHIVILDADWLTALLGNGNQYVIEFRYTKELGLLRPPVEETEGVYNAWNRIEAIKVLRKLKKEYPEAFVVDQTEGHSFGTFE